MSELHYIHSISGLLLLLTYAISQGLCQTGFQRTIVFVYAPTYPGENIFLRGGISQAERPNCVSTPSQDPCAIAIRHRTVPTDIGSAYRNWSSGDSYLDWYGAEPEQGLFQGSQASGTPLMWTTSKTPGITDPTVGTDGRGYTAYNRFGDHFWMLDVDMNCSQTEDGWFEFKTYKTPAVGWETDIAQYRLCAGLPYMARPYFSMNHLGRCGKLNVFYGNENDCNVYDIPSSTDLDVPGTCGQRKMFADSSESLTSDSLFGSERIVNGVPASLGRWPWQGILQYGTSIGGCGAVLIESMWAVTAAHCVRGTNPSTLLVRVGEQNLNAVQGTEQAIRVRTIFTHPRYGQAPASGEVDGDYDIALLQLLTPVTLVDNYIVNPVCIPRGYLLDAFVGNENCWATGFGDSKGTSDPYRLNEIRVPVYSHADCVAIWGSNNISVRQVCMGTNTLSACGGDSGGPLVCYQNGRWTLVGITSWGTSACQGRPSVYTRISEFIDWIDSTTGGAIPLSLRSL